MKPKVKKETHYVYLRDKIIKALHMEDNQYRTFKVHSEHKVFPAKVRIFSEENVQTEIYVSWSGDPQKTERLHCDIKSVGKSLVIDAKPESLYDRNEFWITVWTFNKLNGHIGIAFKGTKIIERGKKDLLVGKEERNKRQTYLSQKFLYDIFYGEPKDYVKDAVQVIKNSKAKRNKGKLEQ